MSYFTLKCDCDRVYQVGSISLLYCGSCLPKNWLPFPYIVIKGKRRHVNLVLSGFFFIRLVI